MSIDTQKIKDIIVSINEIRKKVSIGKKVFEIVADPIEKYFAAQRAIAKSADKNMQKILEFSLLADNYADYFINNKGKIGNPSWLIENLTEASVGADAKNQAAIKTIEDLYVKFDAVINLTEAADGLSNAVAAIVATDSSNFLTSLSAANKIVFDEIKKMNKATRVNIENIKSVLTQNTIDEAIDLLEGM